MLFKNTFEQHPALRFIFDKLQFHSSLGHYTMLNSPIILDKKELEKSLDEVEQFVFLLKNSERKNDFHKIGRNIHLVNNITPTLRSLASGNVMDDIQLFEIKKAAIYIKSIADTIESMPLSWITIHDMRKVIAILDPEHTNIPHFYIYSIYDEDLKNTRRAIEQCTDSTEKEKLRFEEQKIEEKIRIVLSDKIRPFSEKILENIATIAKLDILIAKAKYAISTNSCKPLISKEHNIKNIKNPLIADSLSKTGREFQPVSISFSKETVLITGANMGGKSVLLQTLAMAQYLFQFAFFLPAESASLSIVDEIICSFGDRQSSLSGLSSFAVEILTIDKIEKKKKSGKQILALVDELARTTNPEEGSRLVNGFLRICNKLAFTSIVTTHYGGITVPCKKLRVKGLQIPSNVTKLSYTHISDYMDYSLIESEDNEVPKEAFTIARLLHVDDDFLNECLEK